MHFLSDPAMAHSFPMDYLERVKKVHSEGGYGSQGFVTTVTHTKNCRMPSGLCSIGLQETCSKTPNYFLNVSFYFCKRITNTILEDQIFCLI